MEEELESSSSSKYEISRVAKFILKHNFKRVALQFPDELLKDSTGVVSVLRKELLYNDDKDIGLYVMADTTYGSCCVDEVGASHINADCVIHYGHTCLSPYDATENELLTDTSQQRRILKRRYYPVEKAKDAGIVGILVGTLGVAGYISMIHQIKEMVTKAGKKAYTLVMGRPNPSKLANFPECDVFIYISCAQTALLDSKEFLAPVITPLKLCLHSMLD